MAGPEVPVEAGAAQPAAGRPTSIEVGRSLLNAIKNGKAGPNPLLRSTAVEQNEAFFTASAKPEEADVPLMRMTLGAVVEIARPHATPSSNTESAEQYRELGSALRESLAATQGFVQSDVNRAAFLDRAHELYLKEFDKDGSNLAVSAWISLEAQRAYEITANLEHALDAEATSPVTLDVNLVPPPDAESVILDDIRPVVEAIHGKDTSSQPAAERVLEKIAEEDVTEQGKRQVRAAKSVARIAERNSYFAFIAEEDRAGRLDDLADLAKTNRDERMLGYITRYEKFKTPGESTQHHEYSVQTLTAAVERSSERLRANGVVVPVLAKEGGKIVRKPPERQEQEEAEYIEEAPKAEAANEVIEEAANETDVAGDALEQELREIEEKGNDAAKREEALQRFVAKYGVDVAQKIAEARQIADLAAIAAKAPKPEGPTPHEQLLKDLLKEQTKSPRAAFLQQQRAAKDSEVRVALEQIDSARDAKIAELAAGGPRALGVQRYRERYPVDAQALRNREAVRVYPDPAQDPAIIALRARIASRINNRAQPGQAQAPLTTQSVTRSEYDAFVHGLYGYKAQGYLGGETAEAIVARLSPTADRPFMSPGDGVRYEIAKALLRQEAGPQPAQQPAPGARQAGQARSSGGQQPAAAPSPVVNPQYAQSGSGPTTPFNAAAPVGSAPAPAVPTAPMLSPEQMRMQEGLEKLVENLYTQEFAQLKPKELRKRVNREIRRMGRGLSGGDRRVLDGFIRLAAGEDPSTVTVSNKGKGNIGAAVELLVARMQDADTRSKMLDPKQDAAGKTFREKRVAKIATNLRQFVEDQKLNPDQMQNLTEKLAALDGIFGEKKESLFTYLAQMLLAAGVSVVISAGKETAPKATAA